MGDMRRIVGENLARVRERIAAAAWRAGRDPASVRLVGVTKYVDVDVARALFESGCHDLGESRPQELWRKAEALADLPIRWHLIGHLQRNKVQRTLPHVALLHAGDSLRLLAEVSKQRLAERGSTDSVASSLPLPTLLEVNVSGDAAKHGFTLEQVEASLPEIAALKGVQVQGFMAMSGLDSDEHQARREFAQVRALAERLRDGAPTGVTFSELSMGMSGDLEAAIAEGATLVRIGSALFEGLTP